METILDIAIASVLISVSLISFSLAFWLGQFVLDRFLVMSLPTIVELYGRLRYPDKFLEKE